jgi:hypothetical protein
MAGASTRTRELRLRTRFVHDERPAAEVLPVELGNRLLGVFLVLHFHEREPARAASGLIAHHAHRFDGARLLEHFLELRFSRGERKVSDEQFPTHVFLDSYLTKNLA